MLVLTRKVGESIRIGDEIEVVVTGIDQNKVRIGIRSPHDIPIYRAEVYEKIQVQNREAALMETEDLDAMLTLFDPKTN